MYRVDMNDICTIQLATYTIVHTYSFRIRSNAKRHVEALEDANPTNKRPGCYLIA